VKVLDSITNNSATIARAYIQSGWPVVPIPHGGKAPSGKEWQKQRITDAEVDHHFGPNSNIGVLLGKPSGDLIDIDLDCMEAIKLAPRFLPFTPAIFGRLSRPQSHYLYFCETSKATFKNADGNMLVELRSTGGQTVFPGSTHPSGECIAWHVEGKPATVSAKIIRAAVALLAACALLAQVWNTGSRHDLALSIAGGLQRAGWSREGAIKFILSAADAAGDKELNDRAKAASDTFTKAETGASFNGWPSVEAIIGDKSVQRIQEFFSVAAETITPAQAGTDLPVVKVNNRMPFEIADEVLAVLLAANTPPKIFVRSGRLTRVRDDENGKPIIEILSEAHLRERLGTIAHFVNETQRGRVTIYPPMALIQDIKARESWNFPALEAITETPTLRLDGTILDAEGYDPVSRLIYHPAKGLSVPQVPEHPTLEDVRRAVAMIDDVMCDFPFLDDASRANAFALLFTPIIRPTIDLAPLAIIDAPQAGTGKGKLTDVVSLIATGRPASKGCVPSDSDELEKRITSLLSAGSTFICFDDVAQTLNSNVLASALTASEWEGRILGRSEMARVPQRATWIVTGNNIRLAGDIPRRCYWIRLDAKTSQPYLRANFRHPQLELYVRDHRGELLAALLTLARAWYVAGQPQANARPLGSFERWAQIIGGILEHAGVSGFLANADELYEQADDESAQWEDFLQACSETFGERALTVAEMSNQIHTPPLRNSLPDFLTEAIISGKGDLKKLLGKSLAKRADRRYGDEGWHVARAGHDSQKKVIRWKFANNKEVKK
jgi:hypothetical protein